MSYLLSIVIPTYNRASLLSRQLDSLYKQLKNRDDIEILVCDNCSEDNTYEIVDRLKQKHNNINYFRQEKNIGLDGNVFSCYEHGKGQYIWFLSDDDIILDDSIERVLNGIKSDATVISYSFCNEFDYEQKDTVRTHYSLDENSAVEDFFKVIMISTLVVKKMNIDLEKLKKLPATIFPQITLALILLQKKFHLVAREEIILIREPGYVSGNFFELYCIKPRLAIKNAKISSEEEERLLKFTEKSLKEFIRLSVLEKIGFYKSKVGLPFKSILKALDEFGNTNLNSLIIIIIFLISRVPKIILLYCILFIVAIKNRSIKKAVDYKSNLFCHIKTNIEKAKNSDV